MSKKRCNGEGSITKRADGRWECAVMLGYQRDGRRRRKSFYGETRKEALDKMRDYVEKLERGEVNPEQKQTKRGVVRFSEWADTWFEGHKENVSRATQQSYTYTLTALKDRLGDRPIAAIKAMDIEALLRDFRKEGKSDSYVAKARGMLYQS